MNILQVGSSLFDWGGIERYVGYLQAGLIERGHEVEVARPGGSPLAEHTSHGIDLSVRGKHDLAALAQYLKLFRERRSDVVHIHFNPDFLEAGLAARMRRQPFSVLTRHVALPWSAAKVRMYGPLFDHIIPVSHAVEKLLLGSGIPPSKMTVAKAGCPALQPTASRDLMRRSLGCSERFSIGTFGRLSPEKGIDLLFQASMMGRTSAAEFHVFGGGPLLEEYQKLAAQTGVAVHGFRKDVADCMNAMDAIIVPSRWEEAFPYAALEAMSLGKPMLVSRVGGLLEMVQEGKTGVSFEKENASALAGAARRISSDTALAQEMGVRAKELHRNEYTVEKMAERIEAVYLANRA